MKLALLALFILLSIGDAVTTRIALRMPGAYEASPIGRYLIGDGSSLVRMLALKAVLVAIVAYALFGHAEQHWVDVLRWTVIAILLAASLFAVANNLRVIRKG